MDERSQPRADRRRLTHVDRGGRPRMVDVSAKPITARRAVAEAEVVCSQETLSLVIDGRGPKGEIWEAYKSLPRLLKSCAAILSETPLFVILTAYAVKTSAIHIAQALDEITRQLKGRLEMGELVTPEKSAGRLLSQAVFARWTAS